MDHRILSASARPAARVVGTITVASVVAAVAVSMAFAQQQPATPPAGQPSQQGQKVQMPQLIYSEWTKFCVTPGEGKKDAEGKDVNAAAKDKAKQICLTGIDGRMESGLPIVAIVAIEPAGEGKKVLRITLPVGMQLQHGTRFIIDKDEPLTAPYVTCFANGCIADYELTTETLGKLKKGKTVVVQGINYDGSAVSVPVPLQQFAKAHDGPPTDPKVLAERQKKLEEELKRKGEELKRQAEEARKKLEQGQQQPPKPQ